MLNPIERKNFMRRFVSALLCAVLLLSVLAGCEEENVPTISFAGNEVPVLEHVPVNSYAAEAFSAENGAVTYRDKRARYGVDVSSHQREIDWTAVRESGIDFAIIRAGYRGYGSDGLIHEDPYFRKNMAGALAAGLDVGVYFFSQATTAEEASEEAGYLLWLIEDYRSAITYPVVYDWERITDAQARTDGVERAQLTDFAAAFCQEVRAAGYTPAVYFNQDLGYLSYDLSRLTDCALWLAELGEKPDFYYDFQIWQYTHTGTVPGISTTVDRNISFVNYGSAAGGKKIDRVSPGGSARDGR